MEYGVRAILCHACATPCHGLLCYLPGCGLRLLFVIKVPHGHARAPDVPRRGPDLSPGDDAAARARQAVEAEEQRCADLAQ